MSGEPFLQARHLRDQRYQRELIQHVDRILTELIYPLHNNASVLDFGCGDGDLVRLFRKAGYDAFGVDVVLEESNMEDPVFKMMNQETGQVPFPDQTFDFVLSDNVLEHVENLSLAFSEIRRLLKPEGCSLHIFPSKYRLLEAHLHIPFGAVHTSLAYMRFWTALGIRTRHNVQFSRSQRAILNHTYMKEKTFYRDGRSILKLAREHFTEARFIEEVYVRTSPGRPGKIYPWIKFFPFLSNLYGIFRSRVLFLRP